MDAFQIGPFYIEPTKGSIFDGEKTVKIEPKAMAVLCELFRNQDQVVSQQALFEKVWPNRIFSPSSLQRVITIIRKALNEKSQNPTYLLTYPKLGYRLAIPNDPNRHSDKLKDSHTNNVNYWSILFVFILLAGALLAYFYSDNLNINQDASVTVNPISLGQDAAFNGKLSNSGNVLAFQSESSPQSIFVSQIETPSNFTKIDLSHPINDLVWHNDTLIVLTHTDKNEFLLKQVDIHHNEDSKRLVKFTQWHAISDLTIANDSSLWFVGQSKIDGLFYIARHDLVLNNETFIVTLPKSLIHISLAPSPDGVYYHYYTGKKTSFGLINHQDKATEFDIDIPDISDLYWHNNSASLLVSNLMKPELFKFKQGNLSLITSSLEATLSDISIRGANFVATQTHTDMDIVQWQKGKQSKRINSKYNDYQAALNSKQVLAFLSSRNGYPQIFIQQGNQTKLVYDNPDKIEFIPPLIWSPDGNRLAFVIKGQVHLLNYQIGHIETIESTGYINRVMSWYEDTLLINNNDSRFIEFNLVTGESNLLSVPLALSQQRFTMLDFIARDSKYSLLGTTDSGLFWGELYRPISEEIVFSLYQNNYLVVQTQSGLSNKITVFNSKLDSVFSTLLDNECLHLTDIDLSNLDSVSWLCTKLEPNNSEIVLVENISI